MARTLPGLAKTFIGFGAAVASIWLLLWLWGDQHYRRALPEDVPVLGMVSATNGFRCGGGGAIFAMTPGAGARIRRDGVAALGKPGVGRGYRFHARKAVYYDWSSWKPTPVGFSSDGVWPGLACLESPLQTQIIAALEQPGAWVSGSRAGQLTVIPDLNIVVFTFFD